MSQSYKKRINTWIISLSLVLFMGAQLFFIKADPDERSDIYTRGAHIDEGLYSYQSREFVDFGTVDPYVCDAFTRSPAFQILCIGAYYIGGTHYYIPRLISIILLSLLFFIITRKIKEPHFTIIFTAFFLFQFHLFQFGHFGLVYIMAICAVLLSAVSYSIAVTSTFSKKNKYLVASAFFLFIAYSTTMQMFVAALILPGLSFLNDLSTSIKEKKVRIPHFFVSIISTILFALLYFIAWYLPHREFFDNTLFSQAGGRFPASVAEWWQFFERNLRIQYWIPEFKAQLLLIIPAILAYFIFLKRKTALQHNALLSFGLLWMLIEFSRMGMDYTPFRYLLAFIAAGAFSLSLIFFLFINQYKKSNILLGSIVLIVFAGNIYFNYKAYQRRTYQINGINQYFSRTLQQGDVVLGAWSPTLTFKSKVHCVPIWQGYLNDRNPIQKFKPKVIISETDEAESDYFYKTNKINLFELSDSVRTFDIWRYKLNVFWLKSR